MNIYNEGYTRRLTYPRILVLRNGSTEIAFGTEGSRNFMLIQDRSSYNEKAYEADKITDIESIFYEPSDAELDVVEIIKLK